MPGARQPLPELFAERFDRIHSLLDDGDIHPKSMQDRLEEASEIACGFLRELMTAGPFTDALKAVQGMTPREATRVLEEATGHRFDDFLRAELQLFVDARIALPNAERLVMQCRDALGFADPEFITGGAAIEAFIHLRHETCDVAERQRLRNRARDAEADQAHRERVGRAIAAGVASVAVGTVDFALLPTTIAPLFVKASGLTAAAMAHVANALFPPRVNPAQG
jgi:hypothetical protein